MKPLFRPRDPVDCQSRKLIREINACSKKSNRLTLALCRRIDKLATVSGKKFSDVLRKHGTSGSIELIDKYFRRLTLPEEVFAEEEVYENFVKSESAPDSNPELRNLDNIFSKRRKENK